MRKYTKKQLIRILRDYSIILGRTPKTEEVTYNKELPPTNQFLKNFKTWNNALKEAGLKINAVGKYSQDYLINKLKEISIKLKRSPETRDFIKDKNLPCPNTYFDHFGSWNNALKLAGLEINRRKDYTDDELINTLKKLSEELERTPMMKDLIPRNDMPEASVFKNHFGSWNNALKLAGLEIKYYPRKWTKKEIIKWLKYKYNKLGKTPGIRDFDNDPKTPGKNTVRKLFGNWTNALREAKIPLKRFNSKKELIKIMITLAKKLNKTPTRTEMDKTKGFPSYMPFVKKFGSYTAACLRAGLVPNDGRNNNIWKSWEKHCEKMAKTIYGNIEIQRENIVKGIPDIYVPNKSLFIDAKTCGYKDFKDQIRRYGKKNKLEFWLIFKGIETKRKNVKYVYAEELAKKMKLLGRKDLSITCYHFIRNIYSDEQRIL